MNLVGAAGFIFAPRWTLSMVLLPTVAITPLTVSLFQWLGGIVLALSTPLALAVNGSTESRRQAYWTLGAGEVGLLAVMALQHQQNGQIFTAKAIGGTWLTLAATLGWRLYCLLVKPEILSADSAEVAAARRTKGQ